MNNYKNYITLIAFSMLLLFQWINTLGFLDTYSLPAYFVSYNEGFGVRRFIGSIVGFFFPDYISSGALFIFVGCFTFFLIILFSRFLTKTISLIESENSLAILFITGLLLVSPFSIKFLFSSANYGRLELYLLIIVFIYLLLDIKGIPSKLHYPLLLLCLVIGVLIHQIFVFICLPFFAVTVIMRWYQSRYKHSIILKDCLILFTLAVLVIYLQFFSTPVDTKLLMLNLDVYTNIKLHEPAFYYEYSSNMVEHYHNFIHPNITRLILGFVGTMVMMSPFIFILVTIWKNAFIIEKNKATKIKYMLIILCHLFFFPLFIYAMDYGRWFAVLFLFSFCILFYMYNKKDKGIKKSLEVFQETIKQKPIMYMLIFIYATCLPSFQASLFFTFIERILNYMGYPEATIVY